MSKTLQDYTITAEMNALQRDNVENSEGNLSEIKPSDIYNLEQLTKVDLEAIQFINNRSLEEVEALEEKIIEAGINQVDKINEMQLIDKKVGGLYSRCLFIPKWTFMTGKVHKRPYIDILAYGDVSVKSYLADGTHEDIERIDSFKQFEGKEGRKRVLFTHQDTLWITVDPTESDTLEGVESDVVVNTITDYKKMLEAA